MLSTAGRKQKSDSTSRSGLELRGHRVAAGRLGLACTTSPVRLLPSSRRGQGGTPLTF